MFIGLMGVQSNGTLVTPKGKELIKLPMAIALFVQKIQHKIAQRTWKKLIKIEHTTKAHKENT